MSRQSKKLITEVNREAADDAFAAYNKCISQLEVLQGKMNTETTAIKEKYDAKIGSLQEEKEEHFEVMQAYAESNPELFVDKKSIETTHGVFGFRTGMPKLTPRKGFKWPAILELLKSKLPSYVKTKEDVDKERLLADRNEELVKGSLKQVGLDVTQDETFYVAPNLDQVATV